jgi:two-component system, response regulator
MSDHEVQILLVEDNPNDVKLALHAFKTHNLANRVHVVEFIFGTDRYAGRIVAASPKLILLDLKLPLVDGIEVLRRIKADEQTCMTPVVVMTSSNEERDMVESYKLGVNSYIRKPVDFKQFTEVVRQLGYYWLLLNEVPPRPLATDVFPALTAAHTACSQRHSNPAELRKERVDLARVLHGAVETSRPLIDGPGQIAARATGKPATLGEPVTAAPGHCRLLVVDDNNDAATSLSKMLRILGYETRTAFDGVAGLEAAAEFRPDVVLLDIGMPKMNGYDVARCIRQQPWGNDMVLIAVTGWGQAEDRQRTSEAGFDHHLVKPVDTAALATLLASLATERGCQLVEC